MKYHTIYLDMDGVIADFDQHFRNLYGCDPHQHESDSGKAAFWNKVYENETFFRDMPATPHYKEIIELCKQKASRVIILSSPSKSFTDRCVKHKKEWLALNVGHELPAIFERDKHKYSLEGCLLIDDTAEKIEKWMTGDGDSHHYVGYKEFVSFMEGL